MSHVRPSAFEYVRDKGAPVEGLSGALAEYRPALEYIAGFLTRNAEVAAACVEDASRALQASGPLERRDFERSARRATIDSAIGAMRLRAAQLAPAYHGDTCRGRFHAPLPSEAIDLLVDQVSVIGLRLDSLCRFALILRGVENDSPELAASRLGVSTSALEAAYCRALRVLDDIMLEIIAAQSNSHNPLTN